VEKERHDPPRSAGVEKQEGSKKAAINSRNIGKTRSQKELHVWVMADGGAKHATPMVVMVTLRAVNCM